MRTNTFPKGYCDISVNTFNLLLHTVRLLPSVRGSLPCSTRQITNMLELVFPSTFTSSCSAVSMAIHSPLHLRRSQHYQLPPSLWWQHSSSYLPGLQPLPPPALSLLLFTVPEKKRKDYPSCTLATVCGVCIRVSWCSPIADRDLMSVEICGCTHRCKSPQSRQTA